MLTRVSPRRSVAVALVHRKASLSLKYIRDRQNRVSPHLRRAVAAKSEEFILDLFLITLEIADLVQEGNSGFA